MLTGLAPIVGHKPTVLILGSMPSVASLAKQQYYGHPRNAFWSLLARLLKFELSDYYQQNAALACQHSIAIWDVIGQCEREGSLDSAIVKETIIINPIIELLAQHPTIRMVGLNGGTAATLFKRHISPSLTTEIKIKQLPSSSPANARMTFDQKFTAWQQALSL